MASHPDCQRCKVRYQEIKDAYTKLKEAIENDAVTAEFQDNLILELSLIFTDPILVNTIKEEVGLTPSTPQPLQSAIPRQLADIWPTNTPN